VFVAGVEAEESSFPGLADDGEGNVHDAFIVDGSGRGGTIYH